MVANFGRAALFLMLLLVARVVRAQEVPAEVINYPDYIFYNGKIVSMYDPGFNHSPEKIYQAMAVRKDLIQFLDTSDQ